MTGFEYASGLISIVVGLGIARVLGGLAGTIDRDARTEDDWFAAAWCGAILFALIGWWVLGWNTIRHVPEIGILSLFLWITATATFYLAAELLVRGFTGAPGMNHQTEPRWRAFFFSLAAHFVVQIVRVALAREDLLNEATPVFVVGAVLSGAGAWTATRRIRWVHLVLWVAFLGALTAAGAGSIG